MRPLSLKYRNVYDARFFAIQVAYSLRSARVVAQMGLEPDKTLGALAGTLSGYSNRR